MRFFVTFWLFCTSWNWVLWFLEFGLLFKACFLLLTLPGSRVTLIWVSQMSQASWKLFRWHNFYCITMTLSAQGTKGLQNVWILLSPRPQSLTCWTSHRLPCVYQRLGVFSSPGRLLLPLVWQRTATVSPLAGRCSAQCNSFMQRKLAGLIRQII